MSHVEYTWDSKFDKYKFKQCTWTRWGDLIWFTCILKIIFRYMSSQYVQMRMHVKHLIFIHLKNAYKLKRISNTSPNENSFEALQLDPFKSCIWAQSTFQWCPATGFLRNACETLNLIQWKNAYDELKRCSDIHPIRMSRQSCMLKTSSSSSQRMHMSSNDILIYV